MFDANYQPTQNNGVIDTIDLIFGSGNLFSMQKNIQDNVNPLVQLIGLGRGLLEASVRNMGIAFGGSLFGGIASIMGAAPVAGIGAVVAGMASKIGGIGLAIGVALFYGIPFLPFMYFFFSATTWIKSIFVAMIGIPLWAIAHMRIDGDGLPGSAGMQGWFLLLEILIRPVLMVIGLIGGIAIFAAQAQVLAEIWDLVTVNITGFDYADAVARANATTTQLGTTTGAAMGTMVGMRGVLDQFAMTAIFAIVIYMMAVGSFKLTDAIPDSVLRWISAEGFGTFRP